MSKVKQREMTDKELEQNPLYAGIDTVIRFPQLPFVKEVDEICIWSYILVECEGIVIPAGVHYPEKRKQILYTVTGNPLVVLTESAAKMVAWLTLNHLFELWNEWRDPKQRDPRTENWLMMTGTLSTLDWISKNEDKVTKALQSLIKELRESKDAGLFHRFID